MPWMIEEDPEGCSEAKPWAVKKEEDGEVVGCHADEESARKQVAALEASEDGERSRPRAGDVETRRHEVAVSGRKIRGIVPYGVESRDMGGWREVIEPTALRNTNLDDLVATVDHAGVPIARYPTTLDLEDTDAGLRWSLTPPQSRQEVREAVERGDLRAGSWRMVVGRERWDGDTRHVEAISELRDVSVVSAPSYPSAAVEYRSAPTPTTATRNETQVSEDKKSEEQRSEEKQAEARVVSEPAPVLQVDRAGTPTMRSLADEFRSRGFPGERASLGWDEYRTATFMGGTLTDLSPVRQDGVPLGHDQRWIYPVVPQVAVGADATSVQVLRQSSRTLLAGTAVVRDLGGTTTKPEVVTDTEVATVELKQIAGIESGVPNIILEQNAVESLVEQDLRLQHSEGLDSLVVGAFAASGFQAPGTDPLLVSIRTAAGSIEAAGYQPDTVVLTPANAVALDTLRVAGTASEDYVFAPAGLAPRQLYGMNVRVSKTIAAPAVFDSKAFGKLYSSPVTLSRFEENAGQTNTSTIRLENTAEFGVERQDAAIRIASS